MRQKRYLPTISHVIFHSILAGISSIVVPCVVGLHAHERRDDGGHDDGAAHRGLLSVPGGLQHQPGRAAVVAPGGRGFESRPVLGSFHYLLLSLLSISCLYLYLLPSGTSGVSLFLKEVHL